MDAKKIRDARRRLSSEYQNLAKSVNRSRLAAEEINLVKNTEDEGDLATRSHDRDILLHLHESDFVRLRVIEEAMEAIERGRYGKCFRCDEAINEKRLVAVPWATMCLRCQEQTEAEHTSPQMVLAGMGTEETES